MLPSEAKLEPILTIHMHFHYIYPNIIFRFLIFQTLSFARMRLSENFNLLFRLIKGVILFVSLLVILKALSHMTVQDIVVCFLTFIPTGWGLLLVSKTIYHSLYIFSSNWIIPPYLQLNILFTVATRSYNPYWQQSKSTYL